jgi:proliferating cell nuclear antigen
LTSHLFKNKLISKELYINYKNKFFNLKMFVAKLKEGVHLKKLIESIKELVTDINLDISGGGISLQAMDSSHVALVTLNLSYEGFEEYRCDKGMTIGVNITHLSKIMKCGGNDDSIILRAEDEPSALNITFENKSM